MTNQELSEAIEWAWQHRYLTTTDVYYSRNEQKEDALIVAHLSRLLDVQYTHARQGSH